MFNLDFPSPKTLKKELDEYIIGHEEAKKTVCTAVFYHLLTLLRSENPDIGDYHIGSENVMLVGPSGTGKTEMVRKIAQIANLNLVELSAPMLVPEGYVGTSFADQLGLNYKERLEKTEECFKEEKLTYDAVKRIALKTIQHSIVFIDEVDKLFIKDGNNFNRDKLFSLLTALNGQKLRIQTKSSTGHSTYHGHIDTRYTLFIVAGVFEQASSLIQEASKPNIGFIHDVKPIGLREALVKSGIEAEILGRIPLVVALEAPTKDAIRRVITEAKESFFKNVQNVITKYTDEINFELSEEEIDTLVEACFNSKLGMREIKYQVFELIKERLYNITHVRRPWWEWKLLLENKS